MCAPHSQSSLPAEVCSVFGGILDFVRTKHIYKSIHMFSCETNAVRILRIAFHEFVTRQINAVLPFLRPPSLIAFRRSYRDILERTIRENTNKKRLDLTSSSPIRFDSQSLALAYNERALQPWLGHKRFRTDVRANETQYNID